MSAPILNLDYAQAKPVLLRDYQTLHLVLVGCGGTGSWLAPHLARLARVLGDSGQTVRLQFIDPDRVEAKNIPRQNFCAAELGLPKALALSLRYGRAWGLEIPATVGPLEIAGLLPHLHNQVAILIGAVDNAAARRTLAQALARYNTRPAGRTADSPVAWWLDLGNAADTGQVLFGSECSPAPLAHAFTPPAVCRMLPAPSLQAPDLLVDRPEETAAATRLSCAELMLLNAQSLVINQAVAAAAANLLHRLLVAHDLRSYATYLDLAAGSQRSLYTTPAAMAAYTPPAPPARTRTRRAA